MAHTISSSSDDSLPDLEQALGAHIGSTSTPVTGRSVVPRGRQLPISPVRHAAGAFQQSTSGAQRRNFGERLVVRIRQDDLTRPRVPRGREFDDFREHGLVRTFVFSRRLSSRQIQARLRELFGITDIFPVHFLRSTCQGNGPFRCLGPTLTGTDVITSFRQHGAGQTSRIYVYICEPGRPCLCQVGESNLTGAPQRGQQNPSAHTGTLPAVKI